MGGRRLEEMEESLQFRRMGQLVLATLHLLVNVSNAFSEPFKRDFSEEACKFYLAFFRISRIESSLHSTQARFSKLI